MKDKTASISIYSNRGQKNRKSRKKCLIILFNLPIHHLVIRFIIMDLKAVIVTGEAPESDDDSVNVTTGLGFPIKRSGNPCGTIIPGEAPESDDDGTTSLSSISGAVEATVCPPYSETKFNKSSRHTYKYNSLLHKKLRECHQALDKDLTDLCDSVVSKNVQDLTTANRHLLRSEMTLQEAASQLREASNRSKQVANSLINITDSNFLHTIKI